MSGLQTTARPKARFGTIAARIGSIHAHRLAKPWSFQHRNPHTHEPVFNADGSPAVYRQGVGRMVHQTVEDITRHPHVKVKWHCRSPHCSGKSWETKGDLLADHADNKTLVKNEEIHLYLAVGETAGVEHVPTKKGPKGEIVQDEVRAELPQLLLLSDEE